jgi:hypothetical protein
MSDAGRGVQPWFGGAEPWRRPSGGWSGAPDDSSSGGLARMLGAPVAAAALVVAGGLILLHPQHAVTFLRLLLGTIAVAGLGLLLHAVRQRARPFDSIFERDGRGGRLRSQAVPGLPAIEGALREATVPAYGTPLPPGARRRLFSLAVTVLDRDGVDVLDPSQQPAAQARVSPLTWGVIVDELSRVGVARPRGRRRTTPAATAEAVHAVLDDLQHLASGSARPTGPAPVPATAVRAGAR